MISKFKLVYKQLLATVIVVGSCLSIGLISGTASALEQQETRSLSFPAEYSQGTYSRHGHDLRSSREYQPPTINSRWAQGDGQKFRSKSSVIKEVKRRYNARVLKISLNEKRALYSVRVLMPSGKVRNIQVSATR